MKKTILCFLLFWSETSVCYCQNTTSFSVEFGANGCYYFMGDNKRNDFNYDLSVLGSLAFRKLKLSLGVGYSVKSYHSQETNEGLYHLIFDREYNIKYIYFPIVVNLEMVSSRALSACVFSGFEFKEILDYDIKTYKLSGEKTNEKGLLNNRSLGVTFLLGTTFSVLVGQQCKVNLSPFIRYNMIADHVSQKPNYRNIPDDIMSIGIRLGVEYLLSPSLNHIH